MSSIVMVHGRFFFFKFRDGIGDHAGFVLSFGLGWEGNGGWWRFRGRVCFVDVSRFDMVSRNCQGCLWEGHWGWCETGYFVIVLGII